MSHQFDVRQDSVIHVEVDGDLVTAEGIEALNAVSGRRQFTAIAWGTVVIKNDFAIEVFKI